MSSPAEIPSAQRELERPEQRVGPFLLRRKLGRGGFAPVWLADEIYNDKTLRKVALKLFFRPDDLIPSSADAARWRDGILDEARALCRVEHPSIVRFYSLQQAHDERVIGLSMEYVEGKNLHERLHERGKLDPLEAVDAAIAVAWALAAVHQAELVHRDVKPSNVIQGPKGYKLIDFGIVVSSALAARAGSGDPIGTRDGAAPLIGTLGYIAPECFPEGAHPTASSDLFALGVTLFELLTGAMPPEHTRPAQIVERMAQSTRASSHALNELGDLVTRLLRRDPDGRPRHADRVARELEQIRDQIEGGARAPEADASAPRSPIRSISALARRAGTIVETPAFPAHPPLVGRDEARIAITRAADEVRRGGVRIVLISGPLGIGRTRMLEAAIAETGIERRLSMRCSPERRSPLRPLHRALESLSRAEVESFGSLFDAVDRALSPAVLQSADEASFALEGIEDALLWESRKEEILLAIDDLQWGDAQTLRLIKLLVERAGAGGASKLLLIATTRDEPHPSRALEALLGRVRSLACPGVTHIPLAPLSSQETAELAQSVSALSPEIERAVVRGSGHVPFFVMHALNGWRATGAIAWREGAWRPTGEEVPYDVPGVADLIKARLSSFFDAKSATERAAYRALAATALYGGGLSLDILYATNSDEASVERALETLQNAAILVFDEARGEYGFAQEMVRQAVLNLVRDRPWFPRLYRALLDAIAQGPNARTDAVFLATGYEKLGDVEKAHAWLGRAMDAALGAGLFAEAAELGDRRAALTSDAELRCGIELDVVRALVRGRRFEEAKERLQRIGTTRGALELRRRIHLLEVARGLGKEGVVDTTLVTDADALNDAVLACEARMALAGVLPEQERMRLADEAVSLSARHKALEFSARVLRVELDYASNRRNLRQSEEDLSRALVIAKEVSSPWQQLHIASDLAVLEAEQGRTGEAIERLRRLLGEAESLGMRTQMRILSQSLSAFLLREERAAEAAEAASRTAELSSEAGDSALHASALSIRANALCLMGRHEAALTCADEAVRLQSARGDRMLALTLYRRAEILEKLGRANEAIATAHEAVRVAEQHGERDMAIRARLWEARCLLDHGKQGEAGNSMQRLAEAKAALAAGVNLRPPTRRLMSELEARRANESES